jgi:hypothetical protein
MIEPQSPLTICIASWQLNAVAFSPIPHQRSELFDLSNLWLLICSTWNRPG